MKRTESTQRICLLLAWLISLAALLSTLYASEIAKIAVCHLCWYQRIALYPLVILLAIAVFRDDRNIAIYAVPLTIIGALFALYQSIEQWFPNIMPIDFCGQGPSCAEVTFKLFGFITFPFLSFIACIAIAVLLILAKPR